METKNNHRAYEIAALILACLQDRMTPENREKLNAWLDESPEHRSLFMQLTDEKTQMHEVQKMNTYHLSEAWNVIQKNLRHKRLRRLKRVGSIAAMLTLFLGSFFFLTHQKTSDVQVAEGPTTSIVPGRSMARLTASSGESYVLDTVVIDRLPHATLLNGNEIVFEQTDRISQEVKYGKLEIPRGGEYKITLSDGTRIYLNSETELKFPEDFTGCQERMVYLTGEAYFEVAKDATKPFIVKCGSYDVKVLGTSFNISNYSDNVYSHTTLKEGNVEIIRDGMETLLQPGQQAKWEDGKLEVREVNVENYISWMNDNFRFESENIDEIMKRIARWYVVDVFYANSSVRDYHFTGYLPRYADIRDVLELLSLTTNIHFEIKEKTIIVRFFGQSLEDS